MRALIRSNSDEKREFVALPHMRARASATRGSPFRAIDVPCARSIPREQVPRALISKI